MGASTHGEQHHTAFTESRASDQSASVGRQSNRVVYQGRPPVQIERPMGASTGREWQSLANQSVAAEDDRMAAVI